MTDFTLEDLDAIIAARANSADDKSYTRKLVNKGASSPEIYKAARADGMMSLRENALRKMAQGVTTFEEVMTVITEH